MKQYINKPGEHARKSREIAGKSKPKFPARAFDAVAYAAALEVLG